MKPLISVYAGPRMLKNWIARFILLGLGIMGLFHFNENPGGLMVLFIVCVLIAGILKDEEINVYETYWEKNQLFAGGLIKRRQKFFYKDLRSVMIDGDTDSLGELANDLLELYDRSAKRYIYLIYTNDKEELISTYIVSRRLRKAMDVMRPYVMK